MPLQATAGAATYDAFGGGVTVANYIEDVFQTWLYTGNNLTQTITNGVDLAGKGGLVWLKNRTTGATDHILTATPGKALRSNTTGAEQTTTRIDAFNSNGFFINNSSTDVNQSSNNYVSWTFRKQPKFFDVVTYTGNGGTLSVSHALASKPGCVIIKRTDSTSDWLVCTRKNTGNIYAMYLNTTAGQFYDGTEGSLWDSSSVSINWINSNVASGFNTNGASYVMYLFAHDAGGFGASGTDNVISCGYAASGTTVNLGWEPQWILIKDPTQVDDWRVFDSMRGILPANISTSPTLAPNKSTAEANATGYVGLTSTGFYSGTDNIYIAIRRGPMRTPTSGTSVFSPQAVTPSAGSSFTTNFPFDASLLGWRAGTDGGNWTFIDRLRGYANASTDTQPALRTSSTAAELSAGTIVYSTNNTGGLWGGSYSGLSDIFYFMRRAPGFFDVVCYTGTGANRTVNHNLGVVPEMMIVKRRGAGGPWVVYSAALANTENLSLDTNAAKNTSTLTWNSTSPTASVFSLGTNADVNSSISGNTYVAYLFATVAGVSKVGSYTGTGTTLQVNCGFTAGARFVLIKRTDSTGDWYVWDSARGIVAGNDPYLLLNSTAAEVTSTDYVDTYSAGFEISSTAPADINANGGTFIFLAIA